jgi:hypothetical protein
VNKDLTIILMCLRMNTSGTIRMQLKNYQSCWGIFILFLNKWAIRFSRSEMHCSYSEALVIFKHPWWIIYIITTVLS